MRKRFSPFDYLNKSWLEICQQKASICARINHLEKEDIEHIRNWCNFILKAHAIAQAGKDLIR